MATVSVSTETRQVPVVKEVEVKTYTLTLSEREAIVLRSICGAVSGAYRGPRGMSSAIWYALDDAGVPDYHAALLKGGSSQYLHLVDNWPSELVEHPNTPEAQTKNDREGV